MQQHQAQDQGGNDGHLVALENVGGHAGAVTHIIAHQVSDDGSVARVVFGQSVFDLAHQVGAHVGGLGIDTTADTHKQGDQGAAEAKAQQGIGGRLAENHKDDRAPKQTEPVGEHPGEGTRAISDRQRGIVVLPGRLGCHADVAFDGHPHAQLADGDREQGAHHKGQATPNT